MVEDFWLWLDEQQDVATEVGIVASRFWRMTPADLVEHYHVYARRQKQAYERTAWAVHHIMSAFVGSKNAPSVDQLLGRTQTLYAKKEPK